MFNIFKFLFKNVKSIDELIALCNTPEELNFWMQNNLKYVSDTTKWHRTDYWQSPEQTFTDRTGDCEDYSVLAHKVLMSNGYECHILCVFKYGIGHAVCAVYWNNTWYHISNWGLRKTKELSFIGMAQTIYPDWSFCYEATVHGKPRGKVYFNQQ